MRIIALPGVYRPREDTQQLSEAIANAHELQPASHVLELCAGTGAISLGLAARGHRVTTVDISRRAALNARLNAFANGASLDARQGDLFEAVAGERFDAIVANPPYVPAPPGEERRGQARAWNAGPDGRIILDRICAEAAEFLRPGGSVLLIQSSLSGVDTTREQLEASGLQTDVIFEQEVPLGPIAAARSDYLQEHGYCANGHEVMTVIRGRRVAVGRRLAMVEPLRAA